MQNEPGGVKEYLEMLKERGLPTPEPTPEPKVEEPTTRKSLPDSYSIVSKRNLDSALRKFAEPGGVRSLNIGDGEVKDKHIDWGTGTDQVSAVDVPIADVGGYFPTDNVEAALQLLGSYKQMPHVLAASDSPTVWKNIAYHVFTASEDLSAYIATLASECVLLSPGTFRWSTKMSIGTAQKLQCKGSGRDITILDTNGTALTLVELPSTFTGYVHFSDFRVKVQSMSLSAAATLFTDAGSVVKPRRQKWERICVDITGIATSTYSLRIFRYLANLSDISVVTTSGTVTASGGNIYAFQDCKSLDGCAFDFGGLTIGNACSVHGFDTCDFLDDCEVQGYSQSTHNGDVAVFTSCNFLNRCRYYSDNTGPTGGWGTFQSCQWLNNCLCYQSKEAGFQSCKHLTNCYVYDNTEIAFTACQFLNTCYSYSNGSYGFSACKYLTSCHAESGAAVGFGSCEHIVACYATGNTTYGFSGCKQCQQNYSTGNTSGQYTTSYADQSTNACANTAAGGYNR